MTVDPAFPAAPPHFALRMSAFFGGFFLIHGVALPWFPVWLQGRGLTDVEIASVLAIPMAFRVLMAPVGGFIADRTPSRRFAIRLFLVPAGLVFLTAWTASTYLPLLLLTGAAFTLMQMAMPAGEALALTGARRFGVDYGRMRLWGSVAFAAANVGSGAMLGLLPIEAIFWFIFAAFVIAAMAGFVLPRTPKAVRAIDDASRPEERPAWKVLGHPNVMAVVLASGLVLGSHAAFYSFGSIYWQSLGFSPVEIGGFWAVSIACEVLLFAWSGALIRRIGPYAMITIGAVAAILRWTLLPWDLGGAGFLALQSLHALSFAAVFVGTQFIIVRAVPEEMAGSAQSIIVLVGGLIMAGMVALSGPLYAAFGADSFRTMIVLPVMALGVLAVQRLVYPERA
ncbi:MAG: MFS transporter [Bauldia litoralis]|uniref:MFS transporter n=2 Tax=Bauldia litoralis TaxID=665467 RepID=UPI003298364C